MLTIILKIVPSPTIIIMIFILIPILTLLIIAIVLITRAHTLVTTVSA